MSSVAGGVGANRARALTPAAVALAAIMTAAVALRFVGLAHQSFWYDEIATTNVIHGSFWHTFSAVRHSESTPPLYYVIAWLWTHVTGINEAGLRSLSATAGVLTVVVMWAALRELISERAGLIAAALTAVNPMLVWFSQEARAYSLVVLLGALSLWFTLRTLRAAGTPAAPPATPRAARTRGASARTPPALWSLTSCLALLTHYFAAFIVVAELAAMLWVLRADRTHVRGVLLATIPVVVVGLALVPLAHAQEADGRTSWIAAAPIASRFGEVLRELFSANTSLISSNSAGPGGVWAAVGIAGVAIGLAAAVVTRLARQNATRTARENTTRTARENTTRAARQNATASRLAAIGVAAIAVPLVLSFTPLDYFKDRNLIAALAPLIAAFAAGIALARPRQGLPALALVLAAGVAVDVRVQTTPSLQRTNWREVAHIIASPHVPQAVFIDPADDEAALAYYGQRLAPMPVGARVRGVTTIGTADRVDQPAPPGSTATLRRTVSGLTVLRLRTSKAVTMTPAAIARAGQPIFLQLTPAGNRWIATYLADAVTWTRAVARLGPDPNARTTLAHAPKQAAALGPPPEGVPPSLATRLRAAAARAAAAAQDPTPANRAALRRALAPVPSR